MDLKNTLIGAYALGGVIYVGKKFYDTRDVKTTIRDAALIAGAPLVGLQIKKRLGINKKINAVIPSAPMPPPLILPTYPRPSVPLIQVKPVSIDPRDLVNGAKILKKIPASRPPPMSSKASFEDELYRRVRKHIQSP